MSIRTDLIIDSHMHIMPEYRLRGLAKWMNKAFPGHGVSEMVKQEDLVQDLYKGGITHFFNLIYPIRADETEGLNRFNADFCRSTPGAIPFASIHHETQDKAKCAEKTLVQNDFAGFKLHPFVQKFDPWDNRMDPFYEFLQEARKPVLFHTGFEDFYQKDMPVHKLRGLLEKYPELPIVFVHMAFPYLEEVFAMMDEFPELYLDATGVLVFLRNGFQPYVPKALGNGRLAEILQDGLEKYQGRIMFGSDHPVGWGDIGKIFKDLNFLSLSEGASTALKYGAAVDFVNRFLPGFDWQNNLQNDKR